jgi:cellulose synthase/poly-beta-1,6-N-acetylglucosamine synthase-like glycosyltransferase
MSEAVKASIIIPVYNAQGTISLCLESLVRQNFTGGRYEIICVDDGSVDNSLQIMKSFESEIPVVIIEQENSGPAAARNAGAAKAGGEIILFTDSDCELDQKWLEEMIEPFKNDDIGGVQGRYMTRQTKVIALLDQIDIEGRYQKLMRSNYIDSIGTYSAAYRRELFHRLGGFNCSYKTACGEDFEFSFLLSKLGYKMVFAERAICYHRHPDTLYRYLKTKYSRGYWRTLLYKNYKEKIINDSYTSSIMKFQYVLVIFTLLFLSGALIAGEFIWPVVISMALFLILCAPFMLFALKKNYKVALIYPFVLFLRSISFTAGMLLGLLHVLKGDLK